MQPPAINPEMGTPSSRIVALDWTKGALVVCMVIYHAINYSAFSDLAFRFLSFLPPAFILITGFLVGQVYASNYDLKTWKPYARLAIRGGKLLILFAVLNLAYCVFVMRGLAAGISQFSTQANNIFLSGNSQSGIFEVLLPIAYFLLIAPVLLWLRLGSAAAVAVFAGGFFLICVILALKNISLNNLNLLSVGVLGMGFGLVPIHVINRWAGRWWIILLSYLFYRILSYFFGEPYPIQTLAAIVTVLLLFCCASNLDCKGWFGQQMLLLGKYSLLGYLVQIAILQVAVRICGQKTESIVGVVGLCLATMFLTALAIFAIDKLRRQARAVDYVYRLAFA